MLDRFLTQASEVYAYAYFGSVILVALVEFAAPRRKPADTLGLRWSNNFAISILDTLVTRTLFPLSTIAWAALCYERGWGLLNAFTWATPAISFLITLVV